MLRAKINQMVRKRDRKGQNRSGKMLSFSGISRVVKVQLMDRIIVILAGSGIERLNLQLSDEPLP